MSGLDYRTWGDTKNCKGCRYWSEMMACDDTALCLRPSQPRKFRKPAFTCDAWVEGSLGAIDDPAGTPYEEDEA